MANENELQIVLSLIDNASKELKKITGDINKDTKEIEKASDKASKSLKDGFKDAGRELKAFRQAAFAVTAEIAFLGAAVKAWGDHNLETRNSLNQLATNSKNIFAMFGSIFAPAVNALSQVIQENMKYLQSFAKVIQDAYTWLFQKISFGTQYLIAFTSAMQNGASASQAHAIAIKIAGDAAEEMGKKFKAAFVENIPQMDEAKNKLKEMNNALDSLNLAYLSGQITAQQYYDTLTAGDNAAYQTAQMRMQLMQQMAAQENLMRNQSLLDYQTDIQARMGLLKTLQSYHHTAYSAMFDFVNMGIQKFSSGFTTALTSIIMGTKKASEAFKEFGLQLVTSIVEFVIQYGIQMLIAAALSKVIMAQTISQATMIAAAWVPAAILASIATLGGAGAAGAAGMAAGTTAGMGIGAAAIAAAKGMGAGLGTGTGGGGGWAEGGWVGLNGPQLGWVGEKGPEYIVPNNRLNEMGKQTTIHIEINNPTVRSDEDIDKLTEEISLRLAREAERL